MVKVKYEGEFWMDWIVNRNVGLLVYDEGMVIEMYVNSVLAVENDERIDGFDASLVHVKFSEVNVSIQLKVDGNIAALSTTKITVYPAYIF